MGEGFVVANDDVNKMVYMWKWFKKPDWIVDKYKSSQSFKL